MARLSKQYYRTANGDKKINCYHISIPKMLLKQASLNGNDDFELKAKKNKIIIERLKK